MAIPVAHYTLLRLGISDIGRWVKEDHVQISIGPYKGVGVIRGFIRGLTQVLNDEATRNLRFCT